MIKKNDLSSMVSCKKIDDPVLLALYKMLYPYTKCILINSDVIYINSNCNFVIYNDSVSYDDFISFIIQKFHNMSKENNGWIPLRLFLPSGVVQIIAIWVFFITLRGFEKTIQYSVLASLAILPVCYFWERHARIAFIRKNLKNE